MFNKEQLFQQVLKQARSLAIAQPGDEQLGYLQDLPGTWSNLPSLPGRGWNFIALPFFDKEHPRLNYRLLMNQYNEEFKFTNVGKGIPNRGIRRAKESEQIGSVNGNKDQFITALDYEQSINQIAVDDFPKTNLGGERDAPIHHEPGLFLQMINETTKNWEIARLASIPHGNSVLALGEAKVIEGAPTVPNASGLPIGLSNNDINSPYLKPYKHYRDKPFRGIFNPLEANALLREANKSVNL